MLLDPATIRALRRALNLNQTQLGTLAGCDQTTVSRAEKGLVFRAETLARIGQALQAELARQGKQQQTA